MQSVTVCPVCWNCEFRVVYFNTRGEVRRVMYGLCIMVIHIGVSTVCCSEDLLTTARKIDAFDEVSSEMPVLVS